MQTEKATASLELQHKTADLELLTKQLKDFDGKMNDMKLESDALQSEFNDRRAQCERELKQKDQQI